MPLNDNGQISLSQIACQAQAAVQEEVLSLLQRTVETILEELRDEAVGRERHQRGGAGLSRHGYTVRKSVEALWGTLRQVRIPRILGPGGEVRRFEKYEHKLKILMDQLVMGFGQGMSLRGLSAWLKGLGLPSASAPSLSAVIAEAVEELSRRRQERIPGHRYRALVVDGVWGKKRKGKKQVLLVALGVLADGRFEALDWEAAAAESAAAFERLLDRRYQRGLETVELIVADEVKDLEGAAALVYPAALRQVCLFHLQKTLEKTLRDRGWLHRSRFRRAYWRTFDAETGGRPSANWADSRGSGGRRNRKWWRLCRNEGKRSWLISASRRSGGAGCGPPTWASASSAISGGS